MRAISLVINPAAKEGLQPLPHPLTTQPQTLQLGPRSLCGVNRAPGPSLGVMQSDGCSGSRSTPVRGLSSDTTLSIFDDVADCPIEESEQFIEWGGRL